MRNKCEYNEYGPETCLTDEVFMLLWKYYATHDVPKTETGRKLLNFLNFRESEKLRDAEMFDPEKVTEDVIPLLAEKYKVDAHYFKFCIQHACIFWTFSGSGFSWKSCRFAEPGFLSDFVSVENLKHTIKQLAIEEGLLSDYQETGGT